MSKPFSIPGCGLMASLEKHFTHELESGAKPDAPYEFADDEVEDAPAGIAPSVEDGS